MAEQSVGFASLCKVKIGDVEIKFMSDWSVEQTNAATSLVYGISGSTRAQGAIQHQIGFGIRMTKFVNLSGQNFDPLDISINDGTQIEIKLDNPDNNPTSNGEIQLTGGSILLSGISPNIEGMSLNTGSPATSVMSFFATNREYIA